MVFGDNTPIHPFRSPGLLSKSATICSEKYSDHSDDSLGDFSHHLPRLCITTRIHGHELSSRVRYAKRSTLRLQHKRCFFIVRSRLRFQTKSKSHSADRQCEHIDLRISVCNVSNVSLHSNFGESCSEFVRRRNTVLCRLENDSAATQLRSLCDWSISTLCAQGDSAQRFSRSRGEYLGFWPNSFPNSPSYTWTCGARSLLW